LCAFIVGYPAVSYPRAIIYSLFIYFSIKSFETFLREIVAVTNKIIVGHAVAQLEGREFDSRWFHWSVSFTESLPPHGVDSASTRNEYQEYPVYLLGVKAAGAWG
jgi:hypothetical protein